MPTRPTESQKMQANRLASSLIEFEHPGRLLALMERLGFLARATKPRGGEASGPVTDDREENQEGLVGIWAPRSEPGGMAYLRAVDGLAADPWAPVERIPPKGSRNRIILIGESVARGFFHDPYYNPAQALRDALELVRTDGYEVVDLARIDQSPEPMLNLCRQALALQPEAMIVLAGNNWIACDDFPGPHAQVLADALRQTGHMKAINTAIGDFAREKTERLVHGLGNLAREAEIPLILMIPEFNLGGYATDGVRAPPRLPGLGANANWLRTYDDAVAAFEAGEWSAAADLAHKLMALDGGVTAAAPVLLARCFAKLGDQAGARDALELARDAELWRWDWAVPRCFQVVRQTMRLEAQAFEGFLFPLDLADRFCEWLEGALPDQRLFMDYCHLSPEGASVAMSSAAAMIEKILQGEQPDWRKLAKACPSPPAEVKARGHLLAAVHNASWGQALDVVGAHCREAARHETTRLPAKALVDFLGRQTPPVLSASYAELVSGQDLPLLYRLASLDPRLFSVLSEGLIRAFKTVDVDLEPCWRAVREAEHDVTSRTVDLLEPFNHLTSWVQPEAGWPERSTYFKAHTRKTDFWFWRAEQAELVCEITCRLPRVEENPTLVVCLNQEAVARLRLTPKWQAFQVQVGPAMTRAGLNRLTLRWPLPHNYDGSQSLQRLADQLEMDDEVGFYPVLGEIAAFTITKRA